MAEIEEALRKAGVSDRATCDRLAESSEKRERPKRNDERRKTERGDECCIQKARAAAEPDGDERSEPWCEACVVPQFPEKDRAKSKRGTDREIDAAGEDDRRHHQREKADFR